MMKELQNGPIVINFEATPLGFSSVDNNHSVYMPDREWVKSYRVIGNRKDGWERVGHSVLIYGYGVSGEGKKFWRVQNSWGAGWGSSGKGNVERGVDAMGIESNAEWATPVVVLG
jgi:C1A family cysteine protease